MKNNRLEQENEGEVLSHTSDDKPSDGKSKLTCLVVCLAGADLILFVVTIISITLLELLYCKGQPIKFPYAVMNKSSESHENLLPIWHYWQTTLNSANSYSSVLYYFLFEFTLIVIMLYVVLEVWLFCVLYKASAQGNVLCRKKWLWWRLFVVTMTFVLYTFDLSQLQYTCTDIAIFPITVFRIFSILVVLFFGKGLQKDDYYDHIMSTKI